MKTLVIVAHPNLAASRVNARWADAIGQQEGVTVHRLYDAYPDFQIDVEREKALLEAHDRIVLQFPLFWYSTPALLKKWFDDVLAYGWAFGPGGDKLKGKELLVAFSSGGPLESYQSGGYNNYTFSELLRPIQATSNLIGTTFLPIFSFTGTHEQSDESIAECTERYVEYAARSAFRAPRLVHA